MTGLIILLSLIVLGVNIAMIVCFFTLCNHVKNIDMNLQEFIAKQANKYTEASHTDATISPAPAHKPHAANSTTSQTSESTDTGHILMFVLIFIAIVLAILFFCTIK